MMLPAPASDLDLLVLHDLAALDPADGDPSDVFIIINAAHEHLEGGVLVHLRGGDILQDRLEQRLEIRADDVGGIAGRAVASRAEQHRGIELLVRGVKVHQQLQYLVDDLVDALVGAVDLVDDDDDPVAELQRAAQNEARLGHGALGRVDEQDNAVDHLQDTLHLAAEVGVARRVDDVDLRIAVPDSGVLRHDRDAALALKVVRVHHTVDDLLVFAVDARLLEHLVDERGLAVVDVCDNGDVSQFIHSLFTLLKQN